MPDSKAPPGAIFVCGACGKTSTTRYGDGSNSWDESCMLNATLCDEASLVRGEHGRVVEAEAWKGEESGTPERGGGER